MLVGPFEIILGLLGLMSRVWLRCAHATGEATVAPSRQHQLKPK
jgi:hypothetical protein